MVMATSPMGRPGGNSASSSSKRIETCPFNVHGNRSFLWLGDWLFAEEI